MTNAAPVPATRALQPIDEVRISLTKMGEQFKMVLPDHVPMEKFIRVAITAVQQNQDLLGASRPSLYGACMKCATDGLIPDGREAALVIFNGAVQYMPMVSGILKKVRNSGELASITAQVVHKGDKFRYWIDDDGEHLVHEPLFFGDRKEVIGVYALAKTKDGGLYIEVLTEAHVQAIKSVSRAKGGPWAGPFQDEMRKKSAIRRLSKRLPMSTDLEEVIRRDDDMYEVDGKDKASDTKDSAPKLANASRLHEIIDTEPMPAEVVVPATVTATAAPPTPKAAPPPVRPPTAPPVAAPGDAQEPDDQVPI